MTSAIRLHRFRVYVALPWLTAGPVCLMLKPSYSLSEQSLVWLKKTLDFPYSVALWGLSTLLCSNLSHLSEFWSPPSALFQVAMLLSVLTSVKEMHCFVPPVFKGMACSNSFGEAAASSCAPSSCLFFKVALLCSWIYLIGFLLERSSRAAFAN